MLANTTKIRKPLWANKRVQFYNIMFGWQTIMSYRSRLFVVRLVCCIGVSWPSCQQVGTLRLRFVVLLLARC